MNDAIITLHDFGAAYENKTVLSGVNASIQRGKITAIIGPSGCGKSTLLKAMNRMLELESDAAIRGSIHLNGQDIHTLSADELRRRVGMVFQTEHGKPTEKVQGILTACAHFHIPTLRLRDIGKLSGHPTVAGMQQIADQVAEFFENV